jgi:hypothetical protein
MLDHLLVHLDAEPRRRRHRDEAIDDLQRLPHHGAAERTL